MLFVLRQTTLAQLPVINKIMYNDTSFFTFTFVDTLSDGFQTVVHHNDNTKTKRLYTQRFDLLGNHISTKLLWQDTVGIGIWEDFVYRVGNEYILMFMSPHPENKDAVGYNLLKFKPDGTVLWHKTFYNKTYPKTALTHVSALIPTPDGGYLVAGGLNTPTYKDFNQIYAAKHNAIGEQIWEKTYTSDTTDVYYIKGLKTHAWDSMVDEDGNYVLYCTKYGGYYPWPFPYEQKSDLHLIKINPDGEVLWEHTYADSSSNAYLYQDIVSLPNGNYFFMMGEDSVHYYKKGLHIIEAEKNTGDIVWEKWLFKGEGKFYRYYFTTSTYSHDGNIIFAGSWKNEEEEGSGHHGAIMKLNLQGDTIWMRFLPDYYVTGYPPEGDISSYIRDIMPQPDGETYVLCGEIYDQYHKHTYAWLLTIDENGYTCGNYVCDTVSGVKPPPGTNSPSGGQGGFTLTPNPTHQTATIAISPALLNPNSAALQIFDTQGRLVNTITLSGSETTTFSTANLTSGIYYCRLQNHPETTGVKMVVW
ncbi:MAG: T9SS type A sorting domain-containing protein [Sphingobacteriales bacterium]|nr:T9SS type A sorting domain-containing protein [Sphingobacteriales bacterium]